MKISKMMLLIGAIFMGTNLQAVDSESLMNAGNVAYESGSYREAIINYEKILDADLSSAALHYNLGCAYFNENYYGQAILHFEKAKQLSPRDADIQHNLEYTKLFIKDKFDLPEPMPLVAGFMKLRAAFSLSEIRLMEIAFFAVLLLSLISYRLMQGRGMGHFLRSMLIVSAAGFILSAGWLWDRSMALEQKHGVVLVEEVSVTSAPTSGASTLFVIHEGTSGEILDTTDAWYKIRLADGKTGWVLHEVLGIY